MRDYQITNGVLHYYQMAGHRNHSKVHYRWKRVGGDLSQAGVAVEAVRVVMEDYGCLMSNNRDLIFAGLVVALVGWSGYCAKLWTRFISEKQR